MQKLLQKGRSIILASLLVSASVFSALLAEVPQAEAASTANFNPGNIITDYVMSNTATMSVDDIQTFLKSKNSCNDTNIQKASYYSSYSYHIENGHFVCMADETFNGKSAAQIIYNAAQTYRINPQVLIVLLQKEQGLVTDTWPNSRQYRSATGYGCPDTAACDTKYYGFENQVNNAAALFRTVLDGGWSNYTVGNNYIQYNPNSACGGTTVYIQNLATASLYRYTPYQPNASALAAGYGTGDSCGAYGNRNFYLYFNDWFGSTQDTLALQSSFLADGNYKLLTTSGLALDIDAGNDNAQIWTNVEDGVTQAFTFNRTSDGYYTIKLASTGQLLSVKDSSQLVGNNVRAESPNSTCAQRWAFTIESGYYIIRSACTGYALDVAEGYVATPGKNVQVYTQNSSVAQKWQLVRTDAPEIADGDYYILTPAGKALDVAAAATRDGANVHIYNHNYTAAQYFILTRNLDGTYTIENGNSGKVLDVESASTANRANIQQYAANGTCAQKWTPVKLGAYYAFRSACAGGNAIDVSNGNISVPYTNVWSFTYNASTAQSWQLVPYVAGTTIISGRTYTISTALDAEKVLDVLGSYTADGTNVQIYDQNGTTAQTWQLVHNSDDSYTIINPHSGKALDILHGLVGTNGSNVQIYTANGTCAQKWKIEHINASQFTIVNFCNTAYSLDVLNSLTDNYTNVQLYVRWGEATNPAQIWNITPQ